DHQLGGRFSGCFELGRLRGGRVGAGAALGGLRGAARHLVVRPVGAAGTERQHRGGDEGPERAAGSAGSGHLAPPVAWAATASAAARMAAGSPSARSSTLPTVLAGRAFSSSS